MSHRAYRKIRVFDFFRLIPLCLVLIAGVARAADLKTTVLFDIKAQPLTTALIELSKQAHVQVMSSGADLGTLAAPAVKGRFTLGEALDRLLVGTGLHYTTTADHTIAIRSDNSPAHSSSVDVAGDTRRPLAAALPSNGPVQAGAGESGLDKDLTKKPALEEIVVTGSHIGGENGGASPLHIYSRDDIDRSGATTLQDFVNRIPQNFGGGASEYTQFTGATTENEGNGAGVNLRGLGNDSTLVLVDGHRVAPGNQDGDFVDISMIPLSAVERVEVLTDGASAIYGSDAVGGVVNFILKKHLNLIETRARYSALSDGGSHETQLGQTLARDWDSGSVLLAYEYYDRTPLSAADRSYSNTVPMPFNLLPEQVRNSVFLNASQFVTQGLELFLESSYSHRSTESDLAFALTDTQHVPSRISNYSATGGAKLALTDSLRSELDVTYGETDIENQTIQSLPPPLAANIKGRSGVAAIDGKLDGSLFQIPSGEIKFAAGAQFRRESYGIRDSAQLTNFDIGRHSTAEFAELHIPIVGRGANASSIDRLAISIAGRHENYSDFGSTNDPQFGVIWNPLASFKIRGTFGRSFKAPNLKDLNPNPYSIFPLPIPDPGVGASSCQPIENSSRCTDVLFLFGGNPGLTAEKATTWTSGFDFNPENAGFRLSGTYYNIVFRDRIGSPQLDINAFNLFAYQALLGPSIIQRNPSAARVQQYTSLGGFSDPYGIGTNNIGAIFDTRSQNLATQRTSGIDFSVSYSHDVDFGTVYGAINGTRILRFNNQFTETAPTQVLLDTVYQPAHLKVRAQASVARGPVNLSVFLNYVSAYTNSQVTPFAGVASWTTADATLSWDVSNKSGPLRGTQLLFSVTNIANREPPYVFNQNFAVYFDGTNANPLGRQLSVLVNKKW